MSIAVTSAVWNSGRFKGAKLLLLLALADFANDQGMCWPSINTLATKARVSRRTAQRMIRELIRAGPVAVEVRGGGRKSSRYRISLSEFKAPGSAMSSPGGVKLTPVENGRPSGAGGDTPRASIRRPSGDRDVTPKPLLNLQRTPELEGRDSVQSASEADKSFFRRFMAALKEQVNRLSFETWFIPLRLAGIKDHTLEVYVPNGEWQYILKTFGQQMRAALRVAGNENLQIVLRPAK